jgi:hypothetical protein
LIPGALGGAKHDSGPEGDAGWSRPFPRQRLQSSTLVR